MQRGRISRRQLEALGTPSATIARLTSQGQLHPSLRGVFAVGHTAPIELADETAALLAARDGAVLCSWSAAALWGLLPPGAGDGLIHIAVQGGPIKGLRGVQAHRTRILARKDTRIHKGLPVTSPARTLLDLAGLLTPRQLERAYDQAIVQHLIRPTHITELLNRATGHPGRSRLSQIHQRGRCTPTLTRSEAEELFLHLIRKAGLPEPEINTRLHGFEPDFLWRNQRLIVEIDGYKFHSTRSAFESDHGRDATLAAHGYTTLRFTWRQLKDEPLAVVATLARALA